MKRFNILLLVFGGAMVVHASDFVVDGVRYSVIPETTTVAVESPGEGSEYAGQIIIPATVSDNGITYTVTEIAPKAFSGATALTGVDIQASVKSYGNYAFEGCTALTSVTLPADSETSFGRFLFIGCSALTEATIHGNADVDTFFPSCPSLRSIVLDPENAYCIVEDGIVYNKDHTVIEVYPSDKVGSFSIPDGVETIGAYAFNGCDQLTKLVIPPSVTSTEVYDPKQDAMTTTNKSIPSESFIGCAALNEIVFQDGTERLSLSSQLFPADTPITHLYIGRNLSFGTSTVSAFNGIKTLVSATIADGVSVISYGCFENTGLRQVSIPATITLIGRMAFDGCPLETISLKADSPSKITTYEMDAQGDNGTFSGVDHPENVKLYVPQAAIPAYKASPVWNIFNIQDLATSLDAISASNDTVVRYYDLQGRPVATPTHGLYIKIQGASTTKVRL